MKAYLSKLETHSRSLRLHSFDEAGKTKTAATHTNIKTKLGYSINITSRIHLVCINADPAERLMRVVKNRSEWRKLVETYVQRWTTIS